MCRPPAGVKGIRQYETVMVDAPAGTASCGVYSRLLTLEKLEWSRIASSCLAKLMAHGKRFLAKVAFRAFRHFRHFRLTSQLLPSHVQYLWDNRQLIRALLTSHGSKVEPQPSYEDVAFAPNGAMQRKRAEDYAMLASATGSKCDIEDPNTTDGLLIELARL